MLKFTEQHEWVKLDGAVATVGITTHATVQLGDLVFIELPEVGANLAKGAPAGVVESVKAASEVYAPLDGEVVEVNQAVAEDPAQVSADPMGDGWLYKLKLTNIDDAETLLDEFAYRALIGSSETT